MEQWTREALEQHVAAEIARGQVSFTALPVDEASARRYQLTTKAVILNTQHSGKETGWVNLKRIRELSRDETENLHHPKHPRTTGLHRSLSRRAFSSPLP